MSLWRLQSQHGGGVSVMKLDHHYSTFEPKDMTKQTK